MNNDIPIVDFDLESIKNVSITLDDQEILRDFANIDINIDLTYIDVSISIEVESISIDFSDLDL